MSTQTKDFTLNLVDIASDPAFVQTIRKAGADQFAQLPWPVNTDEAWRRTSPDAFLPDTETVEPVTVTTASEELDALRQQGVIFCALSEALSQHADLVEQYLFKSEPVEELRKIATWHQAIWNEGLFLYVPKGVSITLPLQSTLSKTSNTISAPHVLIVLEEQAQASLVDTRTQADNAGGLHNEMTEIFLAQGAQLRYVRLQQWSDSTKELLTQRTSLAKDAQFLNVQVGMGGALTKANVETALTQSGSHADLLGVFFETDEQHFDFHTLLDHIAPDTSSDLLYESALKDQAKAVYTGLIRIRPEATRTDARQTNRNLLLNQGAKADAIPMLEIETDDVSCAHAVAVGPVDEDQVFYLMSRGLNRKEAEHLIVQGFLDEVLRRIPLESVRENLIEQVIERLES